MPSRRRFRDKDEINRLGRDFFRFLNEKEADWQSKWKKPELKKFFEEEYKPWLMRETNMKPAYNFSVMMFELGRLRKLKYRKSGRITYHEKAGYAIVDQHSHFAPQKPNSTEFPTLCEECMVRLNCEKSQREHILGARHKLNLTLLLVKQHAVQLVQNKYGVSIDSGDGLDIDEGRIVIPCTKGQVATASLIISSREEAVSLELVALLTLDKRLLITDQLNVVQDRRRYFIGPGQQFELTVRCDTDDFGDIKAPLAFALKIPSKKIFHIFRSIIFSVGGEDRKDLEPTGPYEHPPKITIKPLSRDVLSGEPPEFSGCERLKIKVNLGKYFIPDTVSRDLNEGEIEELQELTATLSSETYSEKFKHLLYSEEHQMKYDIRRYDRHNVTMSKSKTHPGLLNLKVPGLAENRPSVLKGDHIFVSCSDSPKEKTYRGFVHHIEQEVVSLHFHKSLMDIFIEKMTFNIQFTFARFPLRLQHFAVDPGNLDMCRMSKVLFPRTKEPSEISLPKLRLFDSKLERNSEQVQAIGHILNGSSLPGPYLVFGPPGTGKTVTIVEAIKQVYHLKKNSFILACAPSNSACDLITRRLLETGPVAKSTLLRMSAMSRPWESVDPQLQEKWKECLNYDQQKNVFFPSAEEIKYRRIVVVTMVTAGRLVLNGEFKNHFTHIFLDESGYAVEPEALIPVSGLLPVDGQLVLAGDPKQLGPVLRSPISRSNGLELSLLERLMTTEAAYRRRPEGGYDCRMLTKLLRNYRSHPNILAVPNELFYKGELLVCADEMLRNCLTRVEWLPSKGFPVIFHGIEGKDEQEEKSPSFFNSPEAEQVMAYVNDLMNLKGHKAIRKADIGIISPYRKQVQKIQKLLKKRNLQDIKVGSVEEFQGQERLVIIISTVRSKREDFLMMDIEHKLGFLKNPKRFNVAITRAKALLICIGNPYMLSRDEHWYRFIEYCCDNKGYTGCPYTPRKPEKEVEALNAKMKDLKITPEFIPKEEISAVNDPEWRGEGNV